MKKRLSKIALLSAIVLAFSFSASAQIFVNVRPTYRVVHRVPAPGPRHVWIDEDWRIDGGRYVYAGGYWSAPPFVGAVWVPGRWHHRRGGWAWAPGRWRR
jgi:hypothetical protein